MDILLSSYERRKAAQNHDQLLGDRDSFRHERLHLLIQTECFYRNLRFDDAEKLRWCERARRLQLSLVRRIRFSESSSRIWNSINTSLNKRAYASFARRKTFPLKLMYQRPQHGDIERQWTLAFPAYATLREVARRVTLRECAFLIPS